MAFHVNGKWHIEARDLDTMRAGISKLYSVAFADDVKQRIFQLSVTDRFNKHGDTVPFLTHVITATKHEFQRGHDRYDYWIYGGVVVGVFAK